MSRHPRGSRSLLCTRGVVNRAFEGLASLLTECGIMEGGVLLPSECGRLMVVDEKGFSSRSDTVTRGVVLKGQRAARTTAASLSFSHISVASFLPVSGPPPKVAVILPSVRIPAQGATLWPEAELFSSPDTGSMTTALWPSVLHRCLPAPEGGRARPLVLVMDSGGGGLLHLSPSMLVVCHRQGIRPFVLPPHTTRALCALDQVPHATMGALWGAVKKAWVAKKQSMNICEALAALRVVVGAGLDKGPGGWKAVGFEPGEKISREQVLVKRAAEVFQCSQRAEPLTRSVLDQISQVPPITSGPWKAAAAAETFEPESPEERLLSKEFGDLTALLRGRSGRKQAAVASTTTAAPVLPDKGPGPTPPPSTKRPAPPETPTDRHPKRPRLLFSKEDLGQGAANPLATKFLQCREEFFQAIRRNCLHKKQQDPFEGDDSAAEVFGKAWAEQVGKLHTKAVGHFLTRGGLLCAPPHTKSQKVALCSTSCGTGPGVF